MTSSGFERSNLPDLDGYRYNYFKFEYSATLYLIDLIYFPSLPLLPPHVSYHLFQRVLAP
ncbi:hypothetical protein J5X98_23635 [Leptothermofonsia sichuanensis E412]|uniref:hypothetical protein n=1 Tax=Leptothermofonsia sichuanensis TaxID=2917832 RepID=UPI001CA792C1|nr:hypothetical protein [Leptothermofonsia sichuanensis]QZZ20223.1 hypothetical protein J5X98_23635 [Leptothermofonsia sichuanensis E412]